MHSCLGTKVNSSYRMKVYNTAAYTFIIVDPLTGLKSRIDQTRVHPLAFSLSFFLSLSLSLNSL